MYLLLAVVFLVFQYAVMTIGLSGKYRRNGLFEAWPDYVATACAVVVLVFSVLAYIELFN